MVCTVLLVLTPASAPLLQDTRLRSFDKDACCDHCKKKGHLKKDCPEWKVMLWAATTMQANWRGIQSRRTIEDDGDDAD